MEVGDINDPGIAIGWTDDATLHAYLGVAGTPIPQGAKNAASYVALQAWFSSLVVAANATSSVMLAGEIPSSEFFDHISIAEHAVLTNALHTVPIMLVCGPAASLSAGRFYMVTDAGRGSNHAMNATDFCAVPVIMIALATEHGVVQQILLF